MWLKRGTAVPLLWRVQSIVFLGMTLPTYSGDAEK